MSKIKTVGLDQDGTKPFEQQQFGTAGVEGVNVDQCEYTGATMWMVVGLRLGQSLVEVVWVRTKSAQLRYIQNDLLDIKPGKAIS